jgi:hypothetical protein
LRTSPLLGTNRVSARCFVVRYNPIHPGKENRGWGFELLITGALLFSTTAVAAVIATTRLSNPTGIDILSLSIVARVISVNRK